MLHVACCKDSDCRMRSFNILILSLISYFLPLTSYVLPLILTSYLLPLTSYLSPLISYLLPLTSCHVVHLIRFKVHTIFLFYIHSKLLCFYHFNDHFLFCIFFVVVKFLISKFRRSQFFQISSIFSTTVALSFIQ